MGVGHEVTMEGWLYLLHSNRIGLPYSTKRYFVLQNDHLLHTFKSLQQYSMGKDPIRSIAINSRTMVTDKGRKSVQRRVVFVFRLYNYSKHDDHVKLGASSQEEATRWIQSFQDAALKAGLSPQDIGGCPKREWQYVRSNYSSRVHGTQSLSWTCTSASSTDPMTADVIAPSTWTIFGCHNGVRLFKEAKDRECPWKIPGSTAYNLAFYHIIHIMSAPMEDAPLLANFIHGDDAYRNSRFKLIPSVSKGPWIIKQSIRKKGCSIAQILPVNHLDGDVGGSTLTRGLATMAFSYFSNLVVDLAFLIEGKTEEELLECLLGAFQLNHLDLAKSVLVKP